MDHGRRLPASIADPSRSPAVAVVGLLGHAPARVLGHAGYRVWRDASVEFARLDGSALLVLATGAPEPPAWALISHLRGRSAIPVIALVVAPTDAERRRLLEAGAQCCLDVTDVDADLVGATRAVLRDSAVPRPDPVVAASSARREHVPG